MTENAKITRHVPLTETEIKILVGMLGGFDGQIINSLQEKFIALVKENQDPEYQRLVAAYRAGATELEDGAMEMDEDAEVSMGEDPGAYVMAWIRVSSAEAGLCRTCSCAYNHAGDGWDGECPDCADKTETLLDEEKQNAIRQEMDEEGVS